MRKESGSAVKNLPTMQEPQEMWIRSQDQEIPPQDQEIPLEEGKATHSSIPAWRIPWTQRVGHD